MAAITNPVGYVMATITDPASVMAAITYPPDRAFLGWACHGEYGPTLNWSGGTIYGSQKWSGTIFGCRKWSPRTNYGCHKRSPPAITGPGRTIRGNKIIVKKRVRDHFGRP